MNTLQGLRSVLDSPAEEAQPAKGVNGRSAAWVALGTPACRVGALEGLCFLSNSSLADGCRVISAGRPILGCETLAGRAQSLAGAWADLHFGFAATRLAAAAAAGPNSTGPRRFGPGEGVEGAAWLPTRASADLDPTDLDPTDLDLTDLDPPCLTPQPCRGHPANSTFLALEVAVPGHG